MNGSTLTLTLVGALAVGAALGRRGSRAVARPPAAFRDLAAWTAWARTQGVELRLAKTPSYTVEITDLFADTTGTGAGTRVMQALVKAADKAGMPLTLHPSSRRNVTFYERFGFVVTGRDGMMRREPKRGSRATDPTSSPAFRRWFGASKVVDAEGRPLVVFHGSRSSKTFEVFRGSRRGWYGSGMYFTPDRDFAKGYAEDSDGNAGHLVSVYLRMERPYRYDARRNFENKEFVRDLLSPRSAAAVLSRSDRESVGPGDSIRKALVARGYDGIIANNADGTEYIVFGPTQIKSATGNRGTFDPADPRISFNRSAR